jgi:hypothetical protein
MRGSRLLSIAVLMTGSLVTMGAGESSGQQPAQGVRELQCTPVGVTWPASSSGVGQMDGPKLSVIRTQLKPKSARLFLDGRYVGRSHDFRGKKGFLYLLPGDYRLEVVKEGYLTENFVIRARPHCRFDVVHTMKKARGAGTEYAGIPAGKGQPIQWIYGPVSQQPLQPTGGPDPSLRPDVADGPVP